jgi:hypothetical protein
MEASLPLRSVSLFVDKSGAAAGVTAAKKRFLSLGLSFKLLLN